MNFLKKSINKYKAVTILFLISLILFSSCKPSIMIDEDRAFGYIEKQLSLGYRIPGSQASLDTSVFVRNVLENNGWNVIFQEFSYDGVRIRNIVAYLNNSEPELILGTHYDTRQISDQEENIEKKSNPVPGANDGASGTALLLELSHHLKDDGKSIWLVFFDAEDQGRLDGWPWSLGAESFAGSLTTLPKNVVIVDMIGDKDLQIFVEENSNPALSKEIWSVANKLGYENIFIDQTKYALIDDHLPFINRGVPSTLLIDFDYPYWHTNEDTLDKVASDSLKIVGEVLLSWILYSD